MFEFGGSAGCHTPPCRRDSGPGGRRPELAWGCTFFGYAPDGTMPERTQPFATIVTKNYPNDETSRLDRPGVFRVNIAAGHDAARTYAAAENGATAVADPSAPDRLSAHPVYRSMGWLAVLNPGASSTGATGDLLRTAYEAARTRYDKRRRV